MTNQTDPSKPTPDSEKFKPQNVADAENNGPPSRPADNPADTKGVNIAQGSQGENVHRSNGAR